MDEDSEPRTINSVDSGLLELKTAVQNMNIQIESIQGRIKEYVPCTLGYPCCHLPPPFLQADGEGILRAETEPQGDRVGPPQGEETT